MERLSIIDPNRSDNDISGGSSNFPLVQRCFKSAYDTLRRRMDGLTRHDTKVHGYNTILAPLLGGNYSSFRLQRDYLQAIYEGKPLAPQSNRRDRW
jgi:non-canonical poly(A) RNA polymerase PAPD5/7